MSFYASIGGEITYEKEEDFKKAFNFLLENKWIDSIGYFLDECGYRISDVLNSSPDVENLVVFIPLFHYRNLARILDVLEIVSGANGKVVWTSTDGCFSGGILTYQKGKLTEENFDLHEWAEKQDLCKKPQQENFESEEDYWDCYFEYMGEVEQVFFEEYLQ